MVRIAAAPIAAASFSLWSTVSSPLLVSSFTLVYSVVVEFSGSFSDAEAGLLNHRSPLIHLQFEKLPELLGRRAGYEQSKLFQTPPDRGLGERRDGVGMHFLHDRRRSFGRDENGVPARD